MFRFLFRFAGLVLIALSFLFVVYDGTKSIADQTIYISRVGPTWANIHPHSLSAFEPAVEMLAGAWVWNDVIQPYFLRGPGNGPGRGEIERRTLGWPSRVPPRCPRPHGFFVAEAQERLKPSMHGGNAAAEAKCFQLTRSAQAST